MSIYALIDCNNFYVSCERAFNPKLDEKPVVVLSNNDGCIISRSNEAKILGIPMGAPFFKWEKFCLSNNVQVFSSNYELYGDMSQRVMSLLKDSCPQIETYSIDEAFLQFDQDNDNRNNLTGFGLALKKQIKKCTGIPVSIGFAHTKTLAKAANYIAKNHIEHAVFDFSTISMQDEYLAHIPVDKVWGIGYGLKKQLHLLNIFTAKNLRDADSTMLRLHFSVTLEKTAQELRGISCLPLEEVEDRQQIISSRSFGKLLTNINEIEEAISHYAAIACLKLRKQQSITAGLQVFLQTNVFRQEPQQSHSVFFPFPIPTADTRYIIRIAKKCIRYLFREGYNYHKAGIALLDITPVKIKQHDMFGQDTDKSELLMKSIDSINAKMGKNTVFYCAEGIERSWKIKRNKRSPRYTTHWDELARVVTE